MTTHSAPITIAVTAGEPAGIGPDLVLQLATEPLPQARRIIIADRELLARRAELLGLNVELLDYVAERPSPGTGVVEVMHIAAATDPEPGVPDAANGSYILETLERAVEGCKSGEFAAMVTGPVQKSTITESGTPFSGHTEFLAERCEVPTPVMLLCADSLRVALLTTHLPLKEVPAAITAERLTTICRILTAQLESLFGIDSPRIGVLGLNPHAGENGQLGQEEIKIIQPAIARLRRDGLNLTGPLPADSAFTPDSLHQFDAFLAMYHDQGLPVLKHAGFGSAVNVTLGLPIVRTSVDHGTALDLAGTGTAETSSFLTAQQLAVTLAARNVTSQ